MAAKSLWVDIRLSIATYKVHMYLGFFYKEHMSTMYFTLIYGCMYSMSIYYVRIMYTVHILIKQWP